MCGQTRAVTAQPVSPREKLQTRHSNFYARNTLSSRYYSYFLSAPRDTSCFHFLFALSCDGVCVCVRARAEMKRKKERRTSLRKYKNARRCASEFTRNDTHVFFLHLRVSFPLLFLFLKSQTSIVDVFYVRTYSHRNDGAQFCEGISPAYLRTIISRWYTICKQRELTLNCSTLTSRMEYLLESLIVVDIGRLRRLPYS